MHQPNPAIVTRAAAATLPRWGLWLLCFVYVMPGFFGRDPWRPWDMAAFGQMQSLLSGESLWLAPTVLGMPPELDGVLPFWLGAFFIHALPFIDSVLASRVPFVLLMCVTLICTWQAIYLLAANPTAQPVSFAFGGEATPTDYARSLADAGLLALMACLGLALPSHETSPMVVQLACVSLWLWGLALVCARPYGGTAAITLGLWGLAFSGAPSLATALGVGALLPQLRLTKLGPKIHHWLAAVVTGAAMLLMCWVVQEMQLWHWRLKPWPMAWQETGGFIELIIWFTWPCWPMSMLALWRWRRQWLSTQGRHVLVPLVLVATTIALSWPNPHPERSLLLALPGMAALAAFALPTLNRSVSALIDWFTLIFFCGCGVIIWVVWLAMQSGWPPQPAANALRLAPGFQAEFEIFPFIAALVGTALWIWLVHWRVGRHRAALWKSLILPASGAALCWLLLMTLWLPLLNYARSYVPQISAIAKVLPAAPTVCVKALQIGQISALRHHGGFAVMGEDDVHCNWLLVDAAAYAQFPSNIQSDKWQWMQTINRPTSANEGVAIFSKKK